MGASFAEVLSRVRSTRSTEPTTVFNTPERYTTLTDLLTLFLATYRGTKLVIDDEITRPIREKVHRLGNAKLSYLISCPWCTSPYIAFSLLTLKKYHPTVYTIIAETLAASAVTGLINENL